LPDVVDRQTRSQMMAGIKGKNTKPELMIRRGLHRMGFRYRLHDKSLPGKPDMVFKKYHAVIQVQGCFWHGHDCHLFKWPSTRGKFWKDKIGGNRARDERNRAALDERGIRTLEIWECALKGRTRLPIEEILELTAAWLTRGEGAASIDGKG
jgi:DNA mismatch endonuclease (patch repair protein)